MTNVVSIIIFLRDHDEPIINRKKCVCHPTLTYRVHRPRTYRVHRPDGKDRIGTVLQIDNHGSSLVLLFLFSYTRGETWIQGPSPSLPNGLPRGPHTPRFPATFDPSKFKRWPRQRAAQPAREVVSSHPLHRQESRKGSAQHVYVCMYYILNAKASGSVSMHWALAHSSKLSEHLRRYWSVSNTNFLGVVLSNDMLYSLRPRKSQFLELS